MKGYVDCDRCEGEGTILAVPPGLGEQEEVPCPDCEDRRAAE